jgi:type VI secretion system protein ImpH
VASEIRAAADLVTDARAGAPSSDVEPEAGALAGGEPSSGAGAPPPERSSGSSGGAPLPAARAQAAYELFERLRTDPEHFDFFQAMRRLESITCDDQTRPRFGAALRPVDEPIRLGQNVSLSFAPRDLDGLEPGKNGLPPRLSVNFFGLLGPNGALPLHLTEYVRDRIRNAGDKSMSRFLDMFHHRMLMMFYRAWASAEPTANHDLPEANRFTTYVGSLEGIGLASLQDKDAFPDEAKLFYTGRFSSKSKNAEGLAAIIGDFFKMPAEVQSFVGDWLEIPPDYRWRLGKPGPVGYLGQSTTLGSHVWSRQHKFRVSIGPLNPAQFQRLLPGGESLPRLRSLVRNYIGDELRWDLRLFLEEQVDKPFQIGLSRMGWTSWLGRPGGGRARREDLILDPQVETYGAPDLVGTPQVRRE